MLKEEIWEKYKWLLVGLCFIFTVAFTSFMFYKIIENERRKEIIVAGIEHIDFGATVESKFIPDTEYFEEFGTIADSSSCISFSTDSAIFSDEYAKFEYSDDPNTMLYELADKYYQVYFGNQRVSPIYALALANVETGSRANHDITWSALFPSAIVDVSEMSTMDVTTVLSNEDYYSKLTKEWSTRDRGALQMSPTYGTGNSYFNSLMSGTEKNKLTDFTTHKDWISGASSHSGDRFYIPDVCLRLSSANMSAIDNMLDNNYIPNSDLQLIAMLGMYHHRSGVWSYKNHSSKCGEWKSCQKAYDYSVYLTSRGMISTMLKYIDSNPDVFTLSTDVALSFVEDYEEYASTKLVASYPIKVVYAYLKMSLLYSD